LIVRKKEVMNGYTINLFVKVSLYLALFFSCVVSYTGIMALIERFQAGI